MTIPKKGDGGNAFPYASYRGMSLRDYFAGQALAGILANPDWYRGSERQSVATAAYNYADAMLAERERG